MFALNETRREKVLFYFQFAFSKGKFNKPSNNELILLRPTFVFIFKIQSVNISYKYCILLKNGTNILYKYMYILFGIDSDTIWKISNLLLLNSKLQILINLFLKFRSVPPSIQLYAKLEYIGFENTEITYKVLKL